MAEVVLRVLRPTIVNGMATQAQSASVRGTRRVPALTHGSHSGQENGGRKD
ncbi:MAG TPA: hypothetical protein VIP09_09920 [Dehalococcoidia bacterium]